MAQKSKKQHYVPQFYLNAWGSQPKNQVFVYDKKLDEIRTNSIRDVASENYFYDINLEELFSDEEIETLKRHGITWTEENSQFVEKDFSERIEGPFSIILRNTIDSAKKATPWHIEKCFFISKENKLEFASFLAYQFLRTKRTRQSLLDTSSCFSQLLRDLGASQKSIEKHTLSQSDAKYGHLQLLFDTDQIAEVFGLIADLVWLLVINHSNTKLYTSDNPIGTRAHIKDAIVGMNGLASRGVEAFFPLTPDLILVMLDGKYHKQFAQLDRRYIQTNNGKVISLYNHYLTLQAERFIFSSDGDLSVINKIKEKQPELLKASQTKITWGGKTYLPE